MSDRPVGSPDQDGLTLPVPPSRLGALMRELVASVLPALVIVLLVNIFLAQATRVDGQSMEPNLHDHQRLIIEKLSYHFRDPQRGDIVVLRPPDVPNQPYVKRVIAVAGDTVEIRYGQVYINGQAMQEAWITVPFPQSSWGPATVGENEVFVLGDDRPASRDSRYFGMLPRGRILGRAFLCYWPPNDWMTYGRYAPAELGIEG